MIFNIFPDSSDLYNEDVRHIVAESIEKHGKNEWWAGVLTTEIHGHLGIYAIIGVKMGVKALEYLNVEKGDVQIVSYAGTHPPVSCLNDGLQVSTGATLGHGLIESGFAETPLPEATFKAKNTSVHIKLKEDIWSDIKKEISTLKNQYGHNPEYWRCVRELAINYWRDLDRNIIFDIN